ncbi:RagB/SusD family nutrient uptake outer membrane protein [Dysgonomonas sp. Marseille-P4361]|uniref:RagB/SusD family nutrient uptake outer membrane protein n=1 Tax=Dysgonomonas sp. Marseille-P4361 TaxID=2161820 RepID=UPI000D551009|nr:RagB/SusD family nutrient uptake outer membrane protein [Dysgonomonas sp. Marseille-P4361]
MNRKHSIYKYSSGILLFVFLALVAISCSDFLDEDPKGQLATKNFFTNKNDLDASLNALYAIIATSQKSNDLIGTNFLVGDDISTHPASNKQSLREYDQFNVSDNNGWMPSMWQYRWMVVKAANFVINNAARTPDVSEDDIKIAIAQAHYWRAYSYFYLVTTWGKVPVMLEEEINYAAPLQSEEEIYKLIIEDLKIAEKGCPVQYTKDPYVRNGMNISVSQGAVKATMAYVYMCMAGWPLNKGVEYYKLAADKAKEVIDGVENGTYYYTLLDEYWKVYSWQYNNQNPEVLLGIYYNRDRTKQDSPLADFLLDMKQGGWGDTNGEIKFWKDFPDGPRKQASYFPKIMLNDGNLYDWWYDTEPSSRAVVAPVFMKTVEGAVRGTEFDYTNPANPAPNGDKMRQLIRLSEVYCWYAEAVGRSEQINAKAVEVLNKVRNRADGKESNIYTIAMTPTELAEAAYNEHGWEIAGYYLGGFAPRARDMFRMYRYKDHFEFRKQNPSIEVAPGIFRKEAVPVTGTWDDSKMYAPYPFSDASLNPNLK